VPAALLKRAQLLKQPRNGISLFQCTKCRESQKKREKFLFNSGQQEFYLLTIEICPEDLDKNINLGMLFTSHWGNS